MTLCIKERCQTHTTFFRLCFDIKVRVCTVTPVAIFVAHRNLPSDYLLSISFLPIPPPPLLSMLSFLAYVLHYDPG